MLQRIAGGNRHLDHSRLCCHLGARTISAMTRGTVSGGWGWRHHRKSLRKEVDKGEIERPRVSAAE